MEDRHDDREKPLKIYESTESAEGVDNTMAQEFLTVERKENDEADGEESGDVVPHFAQGPASGGKLRDTGKSVALRDCRIVTL